MVNLLFELHKVSQPVFETESDCKYVQFAKHYRWSGYRVLTLSSCFSYIKNLGVEHTRFIKLLSKYGQVLLIENVVKGNLVSIIVRSLSEKEFVVLGNTQLVPYGLGYFQKDFKFGDFVVLVEGAFDRDVLAQLYPNTLAMLSAGISYAYLQILKKLTNRVCLLYDKDEAGVKATKRDTYKLKKEGFQVSTLSQFADFKDIGVLEETRQAQNNEIYQTGIYYYRNNLNLMLGGVSSGKRF